jgi:hypothetical protein
MPHVSHQASHAVGSLVVEFTLQFTTYQMSDSRARAFDKGASKLTLKTILVSILIMKIFWPSSLYGISLLLTNRFQIVSRLPPGCS